MEQGIPVANCECQRGSGIVSMIMHAVCIFLFLYCAVIIISPTAPAELVKRWDNSGRSLGPSGTQGPLGASAKDPEVTLKTPKVLHGGYCVVFEQESVLYGPFEIVSGRFSLEYQDDNNLVKYQMGRGAIWASETMSKDLVGMQRKIDGWYIGLKLLKAGNGNAMCIDAHGNVSIRTDKETQHDEL